MKLLLALIFTTTVFAQAPINHHFADKELANIESVPLEAWFKIDCFGIVSPKPEYPSYNSPRVEKHIFRMHVQFNPNAQMPSILELRNQHPAKFRFLTEHCTEKRRDMTDLSNFDGVWLDWGTDWGFSRTEYGENFIYTNSCRSLGSPCLNSSQCCGGKNICNSQTNTCNRLNIHKPKLVDRKRRR